MEPIIEVNGIGKKYNITHQRGGYVTLRDVLAGIMRNPFRFAKQKAKQVAGLETKEEFWALKDVSFNVMPGEVIGIIGANGAGKSTLLKILTGITPPTEGEAVLRGRVASLLEVGTGFHPELTGRENIFLNGAILGMTKKEIVQKFDEIVSFAGIEKFLDTPVKHYSSGMYVRLAFSVAAHMEPDILLVDEVLAVGDAEFQKKCMGKMEEVTKTEGRTIIFVSHNMNAIQRICGKTLYLKNGQVKMYGDTDAVLAEYATHQRHERVEFPVTRGEVTLHGFDISQDDHSNEHHLDGGKAIQISIDLELRQDIDQFRAGFYLKSENGDIISRCLLEDWRTDLSAFTNGRYVLTGRIPANTLNSGRYILEPLIGIYNIINYDFGAVVSKTVEISAPVEFNGLHKTEKPSGPLILDAGWMVQ